MLSQMRWLLLPLVLFLGLAPSARAGSDMNEVGAFLVFPMVVGLPGQETYITITNAGGSGIIAHIAYINGDADAADYCYECDFEIPLTANDTELLVVTQDAQGGVVIQSEPDGFGTNAFELSCPHPYGMITVNIEDSQGNVVSDNVLLGEEVVVDYAAGYAYSIPAVTLQGRNGGNGDRTFQFDDIEFGKLPRIVAADFIAPDAGSAPLNAQLALFTPGFERQFPPSVDCSVTGFDADENPFSRSFQFGCWTMIDLCDISPEFCHPNLGLFAQGDTHGWLQLNCRVDQDDDGVYEANGGVHGAILQVGGTGAVIRRNDAGPALPAQAAWARLLYQSITTGDAVSLTLSEPPGGLF